MPLAHSLFAPSSAKRVISCPASLKLSMNLPNQENEAAAEGTVAHHVAETCMNAGISPTTLLDKWFFYLGGGAVSDDPADSIDCLYSFQCDEEMVAALCGYIAHCQRRPGRHYVEVRVDISPWCPIPDQSGTSDHISIDVSNCTIYVDDLKYGKGVYVAPQDNYQAISYALGVLNWLKTKYPDVYKKMKKVIVGIYQPRIDNIDEWETTVAHILEIGEYIKERYALAWSDNPPFGPSPEACQYCRVVPCKAQADYMAAAMPDLDAEPSDVFLSDDEASELWLKKSAYEAWFGKLYDYLFKRVMDGVPNTMLRMGEGRGARFWKAPDAVVETLLRKMGVERRWTESKLISPAQAEKKLKKKQKEALQGIIGKKPGSPRLVPMGSKHRDYGAEMLDALPDLDDELGL
jgi:Protein of unknown function (DUF2800).